MPNDELDALKRDKGLLLSVLELDERKLHHTKCVLCGSSNALIVRHDSASGTWFFHCYSCGQKGTVIDAVMRKEKKELRDAIASLTGKAGRTYKPSGPPRTASEFIKPFQRDIPPPVLDTARAKAFVDEHHAYLAAHPELSKEHERGLSEDIIKRYRIGFIEQKSLKLYVDQRTPYFFPASWVLPITDETGTLRGVKLHHEQMPVTSKGPMPKSMKCSWAPFGTEPVADREKDIKPRHSYYTLWPHPATLTPHMTEVGTDLGWWISRIPPGPLMDRWLEAVDHCKDVVALPLLKTRKQLTDSELWDAQVMAFGDLHTDIYKAVLKSGENGNGKHPPKQVAPDECVYLVPGELKALAMLSCGFFATAPTGGESWTPPQYMFEYFRGRSVVLLYDHDVPKRNEKSETVHVPGPEWAARMAAALEAERSVNVLVGSFGRTEPDEMRGPDDVETPFAG